MNSAVPWLQSLNRNYVRESSYEEILHERCVGLNGPHSFLSFFLFFDKNKKEETIEYERGEKCVFKIR